MSLQILAGEDVKFVLIYNAPSKAVFDFDLKVTTVMPKT